MGRSGETPARGREGGGRCEKSSRPPLIIAVSAGPGQRGRRPGLASDRGRRRPARRGRAARRSRIGFPLGWRRLDLTASLVNNESSLSFCRSSRLRHDRHSSSFAEWANATATNLPLNLHAARRLTRNALPARFPRHGHAQLRRRARSPLRLDPGLGGSPIGPISPVDPIPRMHPTGGAL